MKRDSSRGRRPKGEGGKGPGTPPALTGGNGLAGQVGQGFQFSNLLMSINQARISESEVNVQALIEILIAKGIIHLEELDQRRRMLREARAEQEETAIRVMLAETPDKYAPEQEVAVDCFERLHICGGNCCKLSFALSVQDLDEGIVRWDYGRPYAIAQDPADGLCVHFDRARRTCGIYDHRPLVCRSYNCRDDRRVWLDYEKKVINPDLIKPGPQAAEPEAPAPGQGRDKPA
jgi:Fe-S-cluster containining protein